ncbi:MAG: bifunctional glutamate N-acetyltransferase/amino-acid acetyltransferase ArgJ [Kiritimatiellota bacterium]|nr:bifunctional glutamate N-acetyltransferase/amino-acid acetyltransferase ArgJ [Kiritimatiellota bacterium]
MANEIEFIPSGTVTSPRGFCAGATYAGIKKKADNALDLAVLYSETPCVAAASFTTNKIKAAPVLLCQQRLKSGRAQAVVVNAGCANAFTGEAGLADAEETAELVARSIGIAPEDVLVASTGVIGERLPMKLIRTGIRHIALSDQGGHELARAIMTTDRVPKEVAVKVGGGYTIGGVAKGAGMIHPDLATLLCFVTTDAAVDVDLLKEALQKAVDISFNMISVDGDTSTNDTVLILANGRAESKSIQAGSKEAAIFEQALAQVCIHLAKSIARDGEGATKFIEVTVTGAATEAEARRAARTIVRSPLVKTAVHGNDPNWGRVVAAAGRSGAEVVESKIDLTMGNIDVVKAGKVLAFDKNAVVEVLKQKDVSINLNLNLGAGRATAWGCDLSAEYVTINSAYTT